MAVTNWAGTRGQAVAGQPSLPFTVQLAHQNQ